MTEQLINEPTPRRRTGVASRSRPRRRGTRRRPVLMRSPPPTPRRERACRHHQEARSAARARCRDLLSSRRRSRFRRRCSGMPASPHRGETCPKTSSRLWPRAWRRSNRRSRRLSCSKPSRVRHAALRQDEHRRPFRSRLSARRRRRQASHPHARPPLPLTIRFRGFRWSRPSGLRTALGGRRGKQWRTRVTRRAPDIRRGC